MFAVCQQERPAFSTGGTEGRLALVRLEHALDGSAASRLLGRRLRRRSRRHLLLESEARTRRALMFGQ
jgi:hypothetical protein